MSITRRSRSVRRLGLIGLAVIATAIGFAGTAASAATQHAAVPAAHAVPAAVVNPAAVPGAPAGFTTTWSDDFTGASGVGHRRQLEISTPARAASSAPARSRR